MSDDRLAIAEAISALEDIGMPPSMRPTVLSKICSIPVVWREVMDESLADKRERRKALAEKFNALALDVEGDPEMARWSVIDHESIAGHPIDNRPLVSEFLRSLGESFLDRHLGDPLAQMGAGKRTTRMSLKDYAKREVVRIVDGLQLLKTSPNSEIASIVNALLGLEGESCVTRNDVAQTRRQMRKPR